MAVILLYHAIAHDVRDDQLQVSPSDLRRHLSWCADLGYEVVPLADALTFSAEKLVGITFDDGLASLGLAWPGLAERGVRATVFLCPGLTGLENRWASPGRAREPLLGSGEVRRLHAEGLGFGCHGWDHRAFVERSIPDMEQDLARCARWFRETLGEPPAGFAWPFGRFDAEAVRVVGREYRLALAVAPDWEDAPRPLALPRVVAKHGMSGEAFADELALKSFVLTPRGEPSRFFLGRPGDQRIEWLSDESKKRE